MNLKMTCQEPVRPILGPRDCRMVKTGYVYSEIEGTQRDVLTGVMFFIALFVPFAYCMERYLFCFRNIYQQLVAFLLILIMTIVTIRALHPAFQLTYSPMVVIIAFFIVGLSLLVSWIIFMRFEEEMANEQGRVAARDAPGQQMEGLRSRIRHRRIQSQPAETQHGPYLHHFDHSDLHRHVLYQCEELPQNHRYANCRCRRLSKGCCCATSTACP